MTGVAQMALPVEAKLPIDPFELVDLEALERGHFYNEVDLDSWQRACAEEAIRLLRAGNYPAGDST